MNHLISLPAAAAAAPQGSLPTPVLLLIAVLAIAVLLFLIMKVRLHAFFSLTIVSLLTAVAAGVSANDLLDTIVGPFGKTLGNVAMLVGFGAVLGRIIETSGGAQVISEKLIGLFGEKRAPLALSVASLLFGFPIFLDAGFIVMLPIIYTVARRVGGGLLRYALPAAGAFLVMHALVPPHPGPVAAAGIVGADVGLVLMVGLLVGLPTWYVAGYRLSLILAARTQMVSVPELLGTKSEDNENPPSFGVVLGLLLLPLVLIFMNTGLKTLQTTGAVPEDALWAQVLVFLGNTTGNLVQFDLAYAYHFGLQLLGSDPYDMAEFAPMLELYWASGFVTPIDREYPLADAAAAHEHLESRRAMGKVVLRP